MEGGVSVYTWYSVSWILNRSKQWLQTNQGSKTIQINDLFSPTHITGPWGYRHMQISQMDRFQHGLGYLHTGFCYLNSDSMEPEIQKFLTFSHLLYFKKDSITMVTNYNHYATFVIFFLVLKHKFSFNVLVSCMRCTFLPGIPGLKYINCQWS